MGDLTPSKRVQASLKLRCGVCAAPAPDHFHFGGRQLKCITIKISIFVWNLFRIPHFFIFPQFWWNERYDVWSVLKITDKMMPLHVEQWQLHCVGVILQSDRLRLLEIWLLQPTAATPAEHSSGEPPRESDSKVSRDARPAWGTVSSHHMPSPAYTVATANVSALAWVPTSCREIE